jgi:uncharacterized tellurite resistance protein B-like protein
MSADSMRIVFRGETGAAPSNARVDVLRPAIEVASLISAADGDMSDEGWDHVLAFLDQQNHLRPADMERLRAYSKALHREPSRLATLTQQRFATLTRKQRESIGDLAVTIALSNRIIKDTERTALERVFRALDLPPDHLDRLIHADPTTHEVTIDWQAVSRLQQETKQVQDLLAEAFADQQAEPNPDPASISEPPPTSLQVQGEINGLAPATAAPAHEIEPAPVASLVELAGDVPAATTTRFAGLDPRYASVLAAIAELPEVDTAQLSNHCKANGVMLNAAIELINEWSEESCGDRVIDGDGPYTVAVDLLRTANADRTL